MKKYILSIDQGTTSSRVILFDNNFKMLDIIQKEFTQYFPNDGWIEHDPIEIWKSVKNLLLNMLKKHSLKPLQILAIGIANQIETTVLCNKKTVKPI